MTIPDNKYENCSERAEDRVIKVRENKCSFQLDNPGRKAVDKIVVDGCLITNSQLKCDWLFLLQGESEFAYFVELKGTDIPHALDQISATIKSTSSKCGHLPKECHIVCTQYPKARPTMRRYIRRFAKEHRMTPKISTFRAKVKI